MKRALLFLTACIAAVGFAWFATGRGSADGLAPTADDAEAARDLGHALRGAPGRRQAAPSTETPAGDDLRALAGVAGARESARDADASTDITVTLRCAHPAAGADEIRILASDPRDGEHLAQVDALLDRPTSIPLPADLPSVRFQVEDERYSLGVLTMVREPAGKSVALTLTATGALVVQGHGRWGHERVAVNANDTGIANLNFLSPDFGPYSGDRLDATGRIVFDALEPGTYRVDLMQLDTDERETTAAIAVVRPGRETRVDITDEPGFTLELDGVLVANGAPVPSADLAFRVRRGGEVAARTDDRGRFRVEVQRDDDCLVRTTCTGPQDLRARVEQRVQMPAVASREGWILDLGDHLLSGVVLDAAGEAVAGATVTARRLRDGLPASREADTHASAKLRSAPDGSFRIEGLPRGRYLVRASAPRSQPSDATSAGDLQVVTLEGDTRVTLNTSAPCGFTGIVTTDCGEPAAGVKVHLRSTRFEAAPWEVVAETEFDGRFHVRGIASGSYEVFAERPWRLSRETHLRSRVQRVVADRAGTAEVALELEAGTRVQVTAFDRDGTPLVARLTVRDASGAAIPHADSGWPDPRRPDTGLLPAGEYELRALLEDGTELRETVVLTGDVPALQVVLTR